MDSIDIVHAQPESFGPLKKSKKDKTFHNGLCEVGDCMDFLFAALCCPCYAGVVFKRSDESWLNGLLSCVGCSSISMLRTKIRTLGGIKGSIVEDLTVGLFMPFCALRQIKHELDFESRTIV